jgi:hypothetical protein
MSTWGGTEAGQVQSDNLDSHRPEGHIALHL